MTVMDVLEAKGRHVFSVTPRHTMQDVVRLLMAHRIGALLVVDDGCMVGIVTERDVLRECLDDVEGFDGRLVEDVMTRDVVIARPCLSLDETLGLMTRHRIRHLPIVEAGEVVGLISIGDAVKLSLDETVHENGFLHEYIHGRGTVRHPVAS